MHNQPHQATRDNVVNLFSRKKGKATISRLAPEFDGTEILYANDRHPDTLFSLKALAWARYSDGSVHALVPWLHNLVTDESLSDPLNGHWEGYRLAHGDILFTQPPDYKIEELDAACRFFGQPAATSSTSVIQEIPDTIGTHAVFSDDDFHSLSLVEIISWRLLANGEVQAMIADEDAITTTPVLPGDDCLVPVTANPSFRYFFQHGIANRIKEHDPEALAAITLLQDR